MPVFGKHSFYHVLLAVKRAGAAICLLLCVLAPARAADTPPNPVVVGNARLTVVTPGCIRLEYSPTGRFTDAPSLFAVNREARTTQFSVQKSSGATILSTGIITLTYTPDGRPFSASSLQATIHRGRITSHWTPGLTDTANLGGTLRTLDGATGPIDLGQGLLSRNGWFLLDDTQSPLLTADWVMERPAAGTDWYLFGYGDDYRAALRSFAALGGAVPLPRRYALGAWYSRYWPYSSAEYRKIVDEYAAHDFPLDNIVLDMDWHREGWTGWSWNRALLPDAEDLLRWFHGKGLHVTLNLHPADGVGPQEDRYAAFMADMGQNPAAQATMLFDAGSKKYMDTLAADVLAPLRRDGVDFWWLDWQQEMNTRSILGLTNLFWLNELLYRNTAQDGLRGLSFSRWGGWGDHRHPIHFSGDADTGWRMLAFEVPFTSTAGNVGCFFWSHDIGGHMGGRNEETYTRWCQFGAVSPVLRSHSTRDPATDRRPWNYPKWAEDSMRLSFHLRSELFPYIYSSAWEACRDTVPLCRPPYLDNPDVEAAYHNPQEYLFGDNILAAPIAAPGTGPGRVASQAVWFPPGDWYNLFTGEHYAGDTHALVAADIREFPLFARGGVPIPAQFCVSRMATAPLTTLCVRCYPGTEGKAGTFTLYQDDGETTAYQHGAFAVTPLRYVRHASVTTVTVGVTQGSFAGMPARRATIIELRNTQKAARAVVNGRPVPVRYDAEKQINIVSLPPAPVDKLQMVNVTAALADPSVLRRKATARRMAGVTGLAVSGKTDTAMLEAASANRALSPAQQEALLACAGIGLVHKNENASGYGNDVRDYFYAPPALFSAAGGGNLVPAGAGRFAFRLPAAPVSEGYAHRLRVAFALEDHEYRLPADPLLGDDNVAWQAAAAASSSESGHAPGGATDGIVDGYPASPTTEWSSDGEGAGATLTLTWDAPQRVNRIVLYDRPNLIDQVTAGIVTFSDGTALPTGELQNNGAVGRTLAFPSKTITSLTFKVTAVRPGTRNAGLAEIAVYRAPPIR